MKNISKIKYLIVRNTYALVALELTIAVSFAGLPLAMGHSSAAQLGSRYVQMEDSAPSGGTITSGEGDGLQVDYKFSFTPAGNNPMGAIVLDFCGNSPIYNDTTCGAIAGFNTNYSTLTVANQSAGCGTGAFSLAASGTTSSATRVILTRATANATSGVCSFELGSAASTGFTNPSSVGSFYLRMYTYSTTTVASFSAGTPGTGVLDTGGVALSVAYAIQITARVQETLIFCVSGSTISASCSGASAPVLGIGHTSGGSQKVIDSTALDTGVMYSQLSTNAVGGATVRIHSNTACAGLSSDGGTTCNIPPANAGAIAAPTSAMAAGTAGFGLNIAAGSGGTGSVTPIAPYYNTTANYYGYDTTSASSVMTTFGSPVEASSAPCSNVNNTWTFAATASNSTPAGLYAANIAAIATGTF